MADTQHNTVFLRLEGPLQSWGTSSRFVVRDTGDEPSKSGVLGLICAALGLPRTQAGDKLADLRRLRMGVRIDRAGVIWTDYHTAGAKIGLTKAGGGIKRTETTGEIETGLSRRDYLCDASFLVALMGRPSMIADIADSLQSPVWPPYLGRKSCPPAVPVFAGTGGYADLATALSSVPWRPRLSGIDEPPANLVAFIELPASGTPLPPDATPRMDQPRSFCPPVYEARYVVQTAVACPWGSPPQELGPTDSARRPDYRATKWLRETRPQRLAQDEYLCVFCKQPADQVHHIDYTRTRNEAPEDLRSLCRLCHDAITMLEYGRQLGRHRIDPCLPAWREAILAKRAEILGERVTQRLALGRA